MTWKAKSNSTCVQIAAPWVKVYLVSGKRCLAKAKTATARRTLDPLYQQQLVFHEKYQGCVLQVRMYCMLFWTVLAQDILAKKLKS